VSRSVKNLDRLFVHTPLQKKLLKMGVPRDYWLTEMPALKFAQTSLCGEKLSAVKQRSWAVHLCQEINLKEKLLVISSEPTDKAALQLSFFILVNIILNRRPGAAINSSSLEEPKGIYLDPYPAYLVFYNLTDNTTPTRLEKLRDACLRFRYSVKIVVVAGVSDPEEWSLTKLRLEPTLVFKTKDV
jgi:hypothetical protein